MDKKSWNNEILPVPIVHKLGGERWVKGFGWEFNKSFAFETCQSPKAQGFGPQAQKKKYPKFGRLQLAISHNRFSSGSFIKIKAYISCLSLCPSRAFKVNLLSVLASSWIICQELKRYVAMRLGSWEKLQRSLLITMVLDFRFFPSWI